MTTQAVTVEDAKNLPAGLHCHQLQMHDVTMRTLPRDLRVEYELDLADCQALLDLPRGLKVGTLNLRHCTALRTLPENLEVYALDISGCTRLTNWPSTPIKGLG